VLSSWLAGLRSSRLQRASLGVTLVAAALTTAQLSHPLSVVLACIGGAAFSSAKFRQFP
jgi:hypothetical protein